MRNRNWLLCVLLAAGMAAALSTAALADSGSSTSPSTPSKMKDPPDPPGTTPYMDQLRALFAAWDLNGDKFLDKEELAKAFRGPNAKPYDYVKPKDSTKDTTKDATKDTTSDATKDTTKDATKDTTSDTTKDSSSPTPKDSTKDPTSTKKSEYTKYADYNFLVQLDQDGDGQISRDEFMSWARDYAVQLKKLNDQEAKLLAIQAKMANTTNSKDLKALENELKKEQKEQAAANKKLESEMKAADKAMLQQLKPKK